MIKRIYLNDKQNPANIIYPITDEQSVRDGNGVTLETKLSDLPQVKEGAALGRTAYQKPVTGIPESDIAEGVIPDVTNFVTKSVNDLVNYYTKSQTYTKEEVANLIAAIQQFHYEVVASTSAVTSPSNNVLYLVGPTGSGSDKYEEYVYDSTKVNPWIKIGDTSIDLSGYVTTQSLNTILSNYVTSSDLVSALSSKQDTLVSGTNIKTINGENILGSGNITIGEVYTIPITIAAGSWEVDSSITYESVSEAISDGKVLAIVPNGEGRVLADYEVQNGTINVFGSFCQMGIIGQLFVSLTDGETPEADFNSVVVPDSLSDLTEDSTHRTVTDTEKTTWNGKYTKPANGIPSTDMSSDVQTSLGKADSALQSFTETDPTVPAWAKAQNPPTEIFWAEYGVTTASEIDAAVSSNKLVAVPYSGRIHIFSGIIGTGYYFNCAYGGQNIAGVRLANNGTWSNVGSISLQQSTLRVNSWQSTPDNNHYPSEKLVKDSLDAKYEKPSGGIPASDLASGVVPSVEALTTSEIDSIWSSAL